MGVQIQLKSKSNYGRELLYPENAAAKLVTNWLGKKTLDARDISFLRALGHSVTGPGVPEVPETSTYKTI